jgi:hypothetical protein
MFLIFAWDNYYPDAGSNQIKGKASTYDEALEIAKGLTGYDRWEIYDVFSGSSTRSDR